MNSRRLVAFCRNGLTNDIGVRPTAAAFYTICNHRSHALEDQVCTRCKLEGCRLTTTRPWPTRLITNGPLTTTATSHRSCFSQEPLCHRSQHKRHLLTFDSGRGHMQRRCRQPDVSTAVLPTLSRCATASSQAVAFNHQPNVALKTAMCDIVNISGMRTGDE